MIAKPYISFLNIDSDSLLLKHVHTIIAAMTDNANYPTPSPTLAEITTALSNFTTALANASGGGVTLTCIKNDMRAILVGLVRDLASYVQVTCKGNLPALLSSGFSAQKPKHTSMSIPVTPSDLQISLGTLTGELDAVNSPSFGTATYNWRMYDVSTPTVMLQTAQTTAARKTFSGLTPGKIYAVQVNAVGSAGTSDWSNPVSHMVI